MEMNRFLFLLFVLLLCSCGEGEDGLKEGRTDFIFFNKSSYQIDIEGYYNETQLTHTHIPIDSSICLSESIVGYTDVFDLQIVYDSIRITFQDAVSLTSTKYRKEHRIINLSNYSIEDKSNSYHIATYIFTNADYEYAKQKLEERDRHE